MSYLASSQYRFNQSLNKHLSLYLPKDTTIAQVIEYALGLGKRLRPALMYGLGEDLQLNPEDIDLLAMCVESIHCYSLIHDDLPLMDNSDYRRGRLSAHKAFDEVNALLAGSWLQNHAFFLLTKLPAKDQQYALPLLAGSLSNEGIIVGQAMEFDYLRSSESNFDQLRQIMTYKTAALFQLALMLPVCLKPSQSNQQEKLKKVGYYLGMLFQLQDDLDDFEQDQLKPDEQKKNAAIVLGKKKVEQRIKKYYQMIDNQLNQLPIKTPCLLAIIKQFKG